MLSPRLRHLTLWWFVQFEPAVKDAAGKAEPMAKDFTSKTVRPAGDYVADKAVPLTKEYGERSCSPAAFASQTVGVRGSHGLGTVLLGAMRLRRDACAELVLKHRGL